MSGIRKFQLARQSASTATASPPPPATTPVSPPAPVKASAEPRNPIDPVAIAMNQAAAGVPRLLTPRAVAEMLGVTERTLERWRITGEGPRYSKLSKAVVRYLFDDVTAFVTERLRANTAQ